MLRFTVFILFFYYNACSTPTRLASSPSGLPSVPPPLGSDSAYWHQEEFVQTVLLKGLHSVHFAPYVDSFCLFAYAESKENIKAQFEGLVGLGDLNGDQHPDSVYTLTAFDCSDYYIGAYYFTDTSLPRLLTDSECCHPENIFAMGDIDEDGLQEIAQFYSSCASRYKSMLYWTLKDGSWQQFGRSTFCLNETYDPYRNFSQRYRKLAKGVVEVLEISDEDAEENLTTEWLRLEIK